MATINWGRVCLGGVVAGVLYFFGDFVTHGVVLDSQWKETMKSLGRELNQTAAGFVIFSILDLGAGLAAVTVYAAIRPRFGAGPRTAVLAAVGVWFVGSVLPNLGWVPIGILPVSMLATWSLLNLVVAQVATQAGAWLYKEASP